MFKTTWLAIFLLLCLQPLLAPAQTAYNFFIGTYTSGTTSQGIYHMQLNPAQGTATLTYARQPVANPSWLSFNPVGNLIYAVNELGSNSTITVLNYNPGARLFRQLQVFSAHGAAPCFITYTPQHLFAANYGGGNIAIWPVLATGRADSLAVSMDFAPTAGSTTNAHMLSLSPNGQYAIAVNLGTNTLYAYKYRVANRQNPLQLTGTYTFQNPQGPRHLVFNAQGNRVYVINEFTGAVATFSFTAGKLNLLGLTETTPAGYSGKADGAEICISADGQYLYTSNRNVLNAINILKVNTVTGMPSKVGEVSSGGISPRNITLTPDGQYLLAANQKSNSITLFKRNATTGLLTNTHISVSVPAPVCIINAP